MRTAVTTSALPRAVGQQCAVTQPPALPIEGRCCQLGLQDPSPQPAPPLLLTHRSVEACSSKPGGDSDSSHPGHFRKGNG